MRTRLIVMLAVVIGLALLAGGGALAGLEPAYHPEQVLVKFRPGSSARETQRVLAAQRAETIRTYSLVPGLTLVKVPSGAVKHVIEALSKNPNVLYAEPDYELKAEVIPNDPLFPDQWGLHNTGQAGGVPDADVDAPEAWDLQTAGAGIVAVIDTGTDYTHPDLAANIWTNPGEIPGDGIDNDGNGYIDDVHGYDFYNMDGDPMDDHGHGTHTAGTVGAAGNNALGVTGVCWTVQIMPVKFLSAGGGGYTSGAISSLQYATMMGARVSSNSYGGGGFEQSFYDAIAAAGAAGAVFVAAAGNDYWSNNDLVPHYPSSYAASNVISVAATDSTDGLAYFSNYGATSVDLGAPGCGIWSTWWPGQGYYCISGTSMATPHVAGAAALLQGYRGLLSPAEVVGYLLGGTDPLPSLAGKCVSGGRLNLYHSLTLDPTVLRVYLQAPAAAFRSPVGEVTVVQAAVSAGAPVLAATVTAAFTNGDPDTALLDDGVAPDALANDGVYTGAWTPIASGAVTVNVSATKTGYTSGFASVSGTVSESAYCFDDTVPYVWEEISGTGAPLYLGDDGYAYLDDEIGYFPFTYYDQTYNGVTVNANGCVYFENAYQSYNNGPIPGDYPVDRFIAALWDDLYPGGGGPVYYEVKGEAPNRRLIVEWYNVPHLYYGTESATFEVILYEATGEILMQYADTVFGSLSADHGASATIGIQESPVEGLQYSYNTASVYDGDAILFGPCRQTRILDVAEATGAPGAYATVPITLSETERAAGLQLDLNYAAPPGAPALRLAAVRPVGPAAGWVTDFVELTPGAEARILAYDPASQELPAGSGPVLELDFEVDAAAQSGQPYVLHPFNLLLTDGLGSLLEPTLGQDGSITILPSRFVFETIGTPQGGDLACPLPFLVHVEARTEGGALDTGYNGTADLSASCCTASPSSISFVNGVWEGSVTLLCDLDPECYLTATDQGFAGLTGDSNTFDVRGKGDATGDGAVDVYDVLRTVNLVLGRTVPQPPSLEFQTWAADMNCDEAVNVQDVILVVNKVLGSSAQATAVSAMDSLEPAAGPVVVSLVREHGNTWAVRLSNAQGVAGIQLELADGRRRASAGTLALQAGWQVDANRVGAGLRVIAYSPSAEGLTAGEGALLRLTSGPGRPRVTRVLLTDAQGREVPAQLLRAGK